MSTIIEQSREFYENQVKPMIQRDFPLYANRIAAGVAGEGSECFGFDDAISMDHDYGIGVCLWLTESDFQAIGQQLQSQYQRLACNNTLNCRLDQRRGVMTTKDFYQSILGIAINPAHPGMSAQQWFTMDEYKLATVVNGVIFEDPLGEFSRVRQEFALYYPDFIWKQRLVNALHDFAGAAQANYSRCMSRGDLVAAEYCRARGIDAAMNIGFLLGKKYGPYYKWKFRALGEIAEMKELAAVLEQIAAFKIDLAPWNGWQYDATRVNTADQLIVLFEKAARIIVDRLKAHNLTTSSETFLEAHCQIIAGGMR